MFAILLTLCGTALDEVSSSIGKWSVNSNKENLYTYGFLNFFWGFVMFSLIVLVHGNFVFSMESLPLFSVLAVLEIFQVYSSLHALADAERSSIAFLMTLTIPIVLAVDYFVGYELSITALYGIFLIVVGIIILVLNHGIGRKGLGYIIFSTINAGATISIYKYLITHYNSVEAQQIVIHGVLMVVLLIFAFSAKENPFKLMFKKGFFLQSFSSGIAGVPISFAYLFAPASVVISAKRGSMLLWSILSGKTYFKEKHFGLKVASSLLVLSGFILLAL